MKKLLSIETIERWLKASDWRVRTAAMNACQGRDVPLDIIERGLKDSDCDVRTAAMNACQGRDVPLDIIERWLKASDWRVRTAAMNACQGRDVPLDIIERWLKASDWRVRTAAMNACKKAGYDLKQFLIRTCEPPEKVYKKCLGDVIVVAEIPLDAQVRGTLTSKCRADKAKIVDIIGDLCGEKVGVSLYDYKTTYFVGDEVYVPDFDYSDQECSTGYHFFCTKEQAVNYNS